MKEKLIKWMRRPLQTAVILNFFVGLLISICDLFPALFGVLNFPLSVFSSGFFFALFIGLPVTMLAEECILAVLAAHDEEMYRNGRALDICTLLVGLLYEILYLLVCSVDFDADWPEQLLSNDIHTPIWTGAQPTVIVIMVIAFIGYLMLNFKPLKEMPPLYPVLGISAMYLGMALCTVWTIQLCNPEEIVFAPMLLYEAAAAIITVRTILHKVREWNTWENKPSGIERSRHLRRLNRTLTNSSRWPLYALLFAALMLGVLVAVLMLFGQAPDSIVRAFTETSDWNLSQKVSPQNVHYDEHYLCTVAAGGHRRVVKPLRLGIRHGHRVIVNRQLCVANAFEQVLEERTPRFHRAVRNFYDRYGFPIARLIHSKYIADLVYFIMKPLEWVFLLVLYLTCTDPENRIAVQYTGMKNVQEVHEKALQSRQS